MEITHHVILTLSKAKGKDLAFQFTRFFGLMGLRMTGALILFAAAFPTAVFASPNPALQEVYWARADLRAAFEPARFRAAPNSGAGFLIDLDDWAEQYGWREYPKQLSAYTPSVLPPTFVGEAPPALGVVSYIVIDVQSGSILAENDAQKAWSTASLAKLMTARLVRDRAVSFDVIQEMVSADEVGGARISTAAGERVSVRDLFYATLVASANNAANALARSSGLPREAFVRLMNMRAQELNLSRTHFADPTGIDPKNVSTARELARLASHVFEDVFLREATQTTRRQITMAASGDTKQLTTTNWMLYRPEYDGLYVTAGKTGYLEESLWNVVVTVRPSATDQKRELMLVVLGANSRGDSFLEAKKLATWAWKSHRWY